MTLYAVETLKIDPFKELNVKVSTCGCVGEFDLTLYFVMQQNCIDHWNKGQYSLY